MVTVSLPTGGLFDRYAQWLAPFFEKLGLQPLYFYTHSSILYTWAILILAAVAAWFVLRRIRQNSTTYIQEPETDVELAPEVEETVSAAADPRIFAAVHQHIGAREDQQDSYGVSEPGTYLQNGVIAVVADGMGGLSNGRAVSAALVRSFLEGFRSASPRQNAADFLLEQAVRANSGVNQMLRGQDRSGSTLVSCVIRNGYLNFLTVGDSRLYLYRGGALLQLNREHIYQEELAEKAVNQEAGLSQVRGDRQAHALTSYFGIGHIPAIDRNDEGIKLLDGDKLLLASDGVFGTLTQMQMEMALAQDVTSATRMLGEQIRAANRTHQDNNTAVVLEYRI